jgi:hypothetical protein
LEYVVNDGVPRDKKETEEKSNANAENATNKDALGGLRKRIENGMVCHPSIV